MGYVARGLVLERFHGLEVLEVVYHPGEPGLDTARLLELLGILLRFLGKTLIVKAGEGFVSVVLSCDRMLDYRVLARTLGVGKRRVRLARLEEVKGLGYEPGCIPPTVTRELGIPGVLDARVLDREYLVVSSGYPYVGVKIRPRSLLRIGYKPHDVSKPL